MMTYTVMITIVGTVGTNCAAVEFVPISEVRFP